MKHKSKKSLKFFLLSSALLLSTLVIIGITHPQTVQAAGFSIQIVPPDCTDSDGCSICEVVKIFTNAANLVGILLSSIALLMFIIGGFMWIFSAGQTERIEKGKKIIIGTVTGLAIVFLAWFAVNVIVRIASSSGSSSINGVGTSTKIFSRDWWDMSGCQPPKPTTCVNLAIGTICGFSTAENCAGSDNCSCYRPLDPTGDDNLCSNTKDAAGVSSASYTDKTCYCVSPCTRLEQIQKKGYACIESKTFDKGGYTKAEGITCTSATQVCAYANK